jgi:ADP-heptose:LPS heptosyltransferase/GT2 family glycosyltransferase
MAFDRIVGLGRRSLRRRTVDLVAPADRARDAEQWDLAVQLYRKALDQRPGNTAIWVQYGHALKESGGLCDPDKLAQAEAAYRTALSLGPGTADTYLQLGHALKLQTKTAEAQAAYLRAFALDPSLPGTLRELNGLGWSDAELCELRRQVVPDDHPATGDVSPRPPAETEKSEDDSPLKLTVDLPQVIDGKVLGVVRGSLQIEGWALARDGVASVDVSVDGCHFDAAKYGLRRENVGDIYPDWEDSRLSGFALQIPAKVLATGEHLGQITLRTRTGRTTAVEFQFAVETEQLPTDRTPWALRRKMPRAEIVTTENILTGLAWRPLFGIILDASDPDDVALDASLRSLREQAYGSWHAVVAWRGSAFAERLAERLVQNFPDLCDRVSVAAETEGGNFADVISRANRGNRPELIGLISAGDVLSCDALLRMAVSSGLQPEAEFFYADERRTSPFSGNVEAFFKPQWSPDLLLATNYIGRFWCVRPGLLERIGLGLEDWRSFGEYDLVLRCTEQARSIQHVPQVVCERGISQIDDVEHERTALSRAMARRGIDGELAAGCAAGYYRLNRRPRFCGLVSIIMPTGGNVALLSKCLTSIFERTSYQNFELIILHNTSTSLEAFPYFETITDDPRVKIIDSRGPFNFSRICNLGAAEAKGELLLFLNDDIEVVKPDWIDALIQHAERPEVGAVGARLLYAEGTVQHAGIFWAGRSGRHAFRFAAGSDPGYFGLSLTPRNVIAVTGACIMMRRSWFDAIGGFDESHNIVNNDVDLCLRCWSNGGLVVYEPTATLIHHELATRHDLRDEYDIEGFWEKWGPLLKAGDPYYHPNLALDRDDYSVDEESVQLHYAGHPLFYQEEIRRILVVKLDHIGDFIIGVPALKRLQVHFPEAELYLLAPPGSVALTEFVPGIKEVIYFEFFHPRSGRGERQLSQDDLDSLQRRLAPYRFDLAIDLRTYLDTRKILGLTGARWLAGYDRDNNFPWLDIALEWEGDTPRVDKRSHVGEDLCRLIDAVASATSRNRQVLRLATPLDSERLSALPRSGRRYVCVNPGAGTETRQWPAEHFAALIDLLAANHDVDIYLIGSADETAVAAEVLAKVSDKNSVVSLVGATDLTDLPALLASAALFVGNNSGPQHIAAGLGIPTVGIYSGTVDAREWGPIGPNAVAVQRNMRCSPCNFSKVEQCPRGLACLIDLPPSAIYKVCQEMLSIATTSSQPKRRTSAMQS